MEHLVIMVPLPHAPRHVIAPRFPIFFGVFLLHQQRKVEAAQKGRLLQNAFSQVKQLVKTLLLPVAKMEQFHNC